MGAGVPLGGDGDDCTQLCVDKCRSVAAGKFLFGVFKKKKKKSWPPHLQALIEEAQSVNRTSLPLAVEGQAPCCPTAIKSIQCVTTQ